VPVTRGASSTGGNGLAAASLIMAGFAVLAALLAVWLGRPKPIDGSSGDDDVTSGPADD
jgi:hypothetical protein